jgi:hypothetical protein
MLELQFRAKLRAGEVATLSGGASRCSTDSVACPSRLISQPIYGHFTLTYPVFRI